MWRSHRGVDCKKKRKQMISWSSIFIPERNPSDPDGGMALWKGIALIAAQHLADWRTSLDEMGWLMVCHLRWLFKHPFRPQQLSGVNWPIEIQSFLALIWPPAAPEENMCWIKLLANCQLLYKDGGRWSFCDTTPWLTFRASWITEIIIQSPAHPILPASNRPEHDVTNQFPFSCDCCELTLKKLQSRRRNTWIASCIARMLQLRQFY